MHPALSESKSLPSKRVAGSAARAAWTMLARFPAGIAAALGATLNGLFGQFPDRLDWVFAFAGAFLWSVAIRLVLEFSPAVSLILRFIGPWLAFLVLIAAVPHGNLATILILSAAGASAIVAAPLALATPHRSVAVQTWAYQIGWAGGLAGAATVILCGGLSALIFGIDALFDFELASGVIWRIWVVGSCLVLPCSALVLLPLPREESTASLLQPAWLTGLLDWLVAPLVLAYGALLNGYCLFILVQREWPKGVIAIMVTRFALVGLVAWIAASAAGPEGGRASRLLRYAFFPGLLAPAVALLIAVWIRIGQHGVTESRYLLVLTAVLLLGLGAGQVIRRCVPNPSMVALITAASLVIVSVGPWGATGVSVRSQFDNLRATLERTGRLRAGLIVEQASPVSETDAAQISSAIEFLVEHGEEARILASFRTPPQNSRTVGDIGLAALERSAAIAKAMGVQFIPHAPFIKRGSEERFSWISSQDQAIVVTGFDYILSGTLATGTKGEDFDTSEGAIRLTLEESGGILQINRNGSPLARFRVGEAFSAPLPIPARPIALDSVSPDGTRLRLLITRVAGTRPPQKAIRLNSASFHLLLGRSQSRQ